MMRYGFIQLRPKIIGHGLVEHGPKIMMHGVIQHESKLLRCEYQQGPKMKRHGEMNINIDHK